MWVLLGEDNNISRELPRRIIESDSVHVVAPAQDGVEAWGLLSDAANEFDVCIFDIFMPKLNGLLLLEKEKSANGVFEDPTVVCERLGIDASTPRSMLEFLSNDVVDWCAAMREVRGVAEAETLLIRCLGIHGSCLNLGTTSAALLFEGIAAKLEVYMAHGPGAREPFSPHLVSTQLEDLEREMRQIGDRSAVFRVIGSPIWPY